MNAVLSAPTITRLPNLGTPRQVLARLRSRLGATLLESATVMPGLGHWSYIVVDPVATLETWGSQTPTQHAKPPTTFKDFDDWLQAEAPENTQGIVPGGETVLQANGETLEVWSDPFDALETLLARYRVPAATRPAGMDFAGGLIGFLGYDLARKLERLPTTAEPDLNWPDLRLHLADFVLAHDGSSNTWYAATLELPGFNNRERTHHDILEQAQHGKSDTSNFTLGSFTSRTPEPEFLRSVERALEYIRAGDIFQVNLTHRLEADFHGDPWAMYTALAERSPAPFAAYLAGQDFTLVGASPERFLRLHDRTLEARPIKGTRAQHNDPAMNEQARLALAQSLKDRAENLMIVDLLRNDLGRVSRYGSVRVPALFALEPHGPVWQMVSTITGELRDGLTVVDALRAAWPGGSMTGAPKVRAMEIIEGLEPVRRGPYAGSVGYLDFTGGMDFNITIRTALVTQDRAFVQVGAGIVADSDPASELEETLAKARAFTRLSCPDPGSGSG